MLERTVTFSELIKAGEITLGDGYRTKKAEHGRPGLPILRVAEVRDGTIKSEFADYVSDAYRTAMGTKVSQAGDIVLTTKGTVGRAALIPADSPQFVYSPQVCFFRITNGKGIDARYLYYWFKSAEFWRQAGSRKSQTDMADYLNLADIRSLFITLPPLSYQQATSSILGAFDDKIANNERITKSVLELAGVVYSRETRSTEDCRTLRLGSAARWLSGGTPKTSEPSYWGGEIPWISASSLKSPWIDDSDRKLTHKGATAGTRLVPSESVIFVVRGSSLKTEFRIGITQREVAFGQDCKALIPKSGIDPHLLFHAIRANTPNILEMVDETSIGAGRLSTDLISQLQILMPRVRNAKTAATLRTFDALAAGRQAESRSLAALRDALLPQLMSGKLRVHDAERIVEDAV